MSPPYHPVSHHPLDAETIISPINDRIYELAKVEFAKGHPSVKGVAQQLAVSRSTLDRIFMSHTGHPAGGR